MIGFCDKWLSSFCSWYRMVSKNVIKDIMVRPLGSRRASGIVMRLVQEAIIWWGGRAPQGAEFPLVSRVHSSLTKN